MQAHGFRVCFTPLTEVLFTFPSRYLCAIGLSVVFSLAGWSPRIPAEFLVLRGTQVPPDLRFCISRTGLSPCFVRLSCLFRYASSSVPSAVLQPRALPQDNPGLGSCAFARHYLRNRCYFLFLRVLRCFSSPGSPLAQAKCRDRSRRVSPFGHPRVTGHLPLTAAFRSLSRPSSPPRATGIPRAPLFAFFLSLRPRPLSPLKAARADLIAYIRLARFFRFSQSNRFDFLVLRSHHVNDLFKFLP